MARSSEKAMTMLARWRNYTLEQEKGGKDKRPYLASECNNVKKAEMWRRELIKDISKKVSQIQNAGLGEFRIRDLNDEINKLLRTKIHWENRIIELGGPNFRRFGPKMLDHEGKEVPGNRGYKYFGAAKDLPGVRELFEKEPPPPPRKTRAELSKFVDADYYGYRDEDDGILVPLEKEAEKEAVDRAVSEWKANKEAKMLNEASGGDTSKLVDADEVEEGEGMGSRVVSAASDDEDMEQDNLSHPITKSFMAHVPVPSQQEIEQVLVERKKRKLLEEYASETLMQQSEEAKTLMGES